MAVLLGTGFFFVREHWPYRYREIKPLLEGDFGSEVKIGRYHRTYFPYPGFVAEDVRLHRKTAPDAPDLGHADRMVVQGRWSDLLTLQRRVRLVEVTGLHLVIPAAGSRANQEDFPPGSSSDFTGPDTAIEQFAIRNSVLDVMGEKGSRLSFAVRELLMDNVVKGQPVNYSVDMHNPLPSGHINARGSFGPLNAKSLAATPVSGSFTFTSVRLEDVGEIHGVLSSSGDFHGQLGQLEAKASTHTPDFAVAKGHPTPVEGSIACTVNALHGDIAIQGIDIRLGQTSVHATGTIDGSPNTTNLDIDVQRGRAQDVMRIFVEDDVPVEGPVWIRAHAYLAPATGAAFMRRLHVAGTFEVPAERLTDKQTEKSLTEFSQRAQDKKVPDDDEKASVKRDTLSSVSGPARIENGIASTPHLVFKVPGAQADLGGTFNFDNKSAHLVGNLRMESDISHAATGFKSFLLKPLAPFFKKKNAGASIPIAVTGEPGHYQVTQDLSHNK